MTTARDTLRSVARSALKPVEFIPVDEWADRYRVLPPGQSEVSGKWSTEHAPYLREPMRAFSDPNVRSIVFQAATQVGKTEFQINCLLWAADVDPGPCLFVYPNRDLAARLNIERLTPSIMACPRVRDRLKGTKKDTKTCKVIFDRMNVNLVGSNSEANVSSTPTRYCVADEIDVEEFDPRALKWMSERTKAFTRRKRVYASKPSLEGEGINALYKASDRRRFFVPCPHCGQFQVLRFEQIKWVGGSEADPVAVEKDAWYECNDCKGRIENHHKRGMLSGGRWLKEGQAIAKDGTITGQGKITDCAGFQLSSLYPANLPWGYAARMFLEEGATATRAWVNGCLGEPWQPAGDKAELADLLELRVGERLGGYKLCTPGGKIKLPPGVLTLVGGIDLQRDRAYVEITGFGERGQDAWLIHHQVLRCAVDDPHAFRGLDALLAYSFIADDGMPMPVSVWGIDSGDGQRTKDVYAWTNAHRNVFSTKGREGLTMGQLFDLKIIDFEKEAKGQQAATSGRVKLLTINTDHYKNHVLARLRQEIGRLDAMRSRAKLEGSAIEPTAGRFYFASDTSEEYLAQLSSEQLVRHVPKTGRRAGRPMMIWQLRPGRTDNHFLDTRVITLALADAMGVSELTAERFKSLRAQHVAQSVGAASTPATPAPTRRDVDRPSWVDREAW